MAGEDTLIMKVFGMQAQMQQQHFITTMQVLNHFISVTERTLNTSGAYQSFGHGDNRGRFHHHGR
eukprot:5219378-Ditylum_brightwellii.AAC.1